MKKILGFLAIVVGMFTSCSTKGEGYKNISVTAADSLIRADSNVLILDVRTPGEFSADQGHLHNAKLIPVQELEARLSELNDAKDRTIIAYCRSGNRSARASHILAQKGFTVVNVEGGITAWDAKGLPLEREEI